MTAFHVVVWDPGQQEYPGGIVVGEDAARALSQRGIALLPCEPELMQLAADGGYSQRWWGAGWPLHGGAPRRFSFAKIYGFPDVPALHWCARLQADGAPLSGSFRLVSDAGQRGTSLANLDGSERYRVDLDKLPAPDAAGGWTVAGRALLRMPAEGPAAFCMWGGGTGARIVTLAITQARE